jgi:hypothetical protein
MTQEQLLQKDAPFEVYQFCKENGIECDWDFNDSVGGWTEIYIGGNRVFQFQDSTTVEQFNEVIKLLSDAFDNEDVKDIKGEDFWFAAESEDAFDKFLIKHGSLFGV